MAPGGKRAMVLAALAVALGAVCATPGVAADRELIGRSVEDRPLVAVSSGPAQAPLRVLVFGAVHGDEAAGVRIARRLIAAPAPAGTRLTVVPSLNPDGFAAGTRGNARGVDLNRNFPFGWRPLGGGEYSGTGPLSEPESRAAHGLVERLRPDLTIWFHQPFGLVDRPDGDPALARRFAQLIGLPLARLRGPYPGSASRWQNHAWPGGGAFVVELPAHVSATLVRRGTNAVRELAAELAGLGVGPGVSLAF